jgi:hypothetical protein
VFSVSTGADTPDTVTIPEGYVVSSTIDGKRYEFSTEEAISLSPVDDIYQSEEVFVYEGKVVTEYFTVGTNSRFVLQSENIDTNSIKVTVINSENDSSNSVFSYAENIYGLLPNSEIYFLQGYDSNQYELVFGDGVFGKKLTTGNIVKVRYRSTNGEAANKASFFASTGTVGTRYVVNVSTVVPAADGSERESLESVKFYAPRFFTTQNRAVTRDDFVNLIRQRYPQLKTVNVYGGEDADPPLYGKVVLSLIPYGSTPIVSDELKADIIRYLSTKTITTEAVIKDPDFLYVEVVSNVTYDPNVTSKTSQQIRTDIVNKIKEYNDTYLANFGDDLRKSKLQAMIDSADASIISNKTDLRAINRITPVKTQQSRVDFTFANKLFRPVRFKYNPGEAETVRSSTFTYLKNGIFYNNAVISDDGTGKMRIYYSTPTIPVIELETNIGTVDYLTGAVSFDINIWDYVSYIDMFGRVDAADITVLENKFLSIDYNKISVTVTAI